MHFLLWILAIILAFLVHELAHVAAAHKFDIKVKKVGINWTGFYTQRGSGTPSQNFVVSSMGFYANFLAAWLFFYFWPAFSIANLTVGLVQLLPIEKSDFSQMLYWWGKLHEENRVRTLQYRKNNPYRSARPQPDQAARWLESLRVGVHPQVSGRNRKPEEAFDPKDVGPLFQ